MMFEFLKLNWFLVGEVFVVSVVNSSNSVIYFVLFSSCGMVDL